MIFFKKHKALKELEAQVSDFEEKAKFALDNHGDVIDDAQNAIRDLAVRVTQIEDPTWDAAVRRGDARVGEDVSTRGRASDISTAESVSEQTLRKHGLMRDFDGAGQWSPDA